MLIYGIDFGIKIVCSWFIKKAKKNLNFCLRFCDLMEADLEVMEYLTD